MSVLIWIQIIWHSDSIAPDKDWRQLGIYPPCGHLLGKGWLLGCRVCCVLSLSQMCPGPRQNQGWGWRRETGLSPPVKYFTDRSKAVLLLWIFYVFVLSCVCFVLCASVYMCFVVTCWERADLLALVCGVFCEFVTFPLVSWVRCGTWLYRFLIFAPLLTFTHLFLT